MGCFGHRFAIGFIYALLDHLKYLLVLAGFVRCLEILTCLSLDELDRRFNELIRWQPSGHVDIHLKGDKSSHKSLVLSDHHYVAASRTSNLEIVFDWDGGDVLTTSCDDELLHAPCDLEETTFLYTA
jgi:hypothetical protein